MTSERLREVARLLAEMPNELLLTTGEKRMYGAAARELFTMADEFDKVSKPGTEPPEPPLFEIHNPDEGRLWALERNAEIQAGRIAKLEQQMELAAHGVEPEPDANRFALTKNRQT